MSVYTGTEIVDEARNAYLNGGGLSDARALAILNASYMRLIQIANEHDVPIVLQEAIKTITALATTIPPGGLGGQLPARCVQVYDIKERFVGESLSKFIPMKEKRYLPLITQTDRLRFWSWSGDRVNLVGATRDVDVKLYFMIDFIPLTTLADTVDISFSKNFLATDVAHRAALSVMHNRTLADDIRVKYSDPALATLLNIYAKKDQSLPVRRIGMRRPGF